MGFGSEPIVLISPDVILASVIVANEQQHVPVTERKEIRTHAILIGLGPLAPGGIERMQVFPFHQIAGDKQIGGVPFVFVHVLFPSKNPQHRKISGQHVVPAVVHPDVGRVRHGERLALRRDVVSVPVHGYDGIRGMLYPAIQIVAGTGRQKNAAVFAQSPVADDGGSIAVHECTSTEDRRIHFAGFQCHRVMPPMHQVPAGDVGVAVVGLPRLDDQHQVIPALPIESPVRIERQAPAAHGYDMVSRAVRVTQKFFAEGPFGVQILPHRIPSMLWRIASYPILPMDFESNPYHGTLR